MNELTDLQICKRVAEIEYKGTNVAVRETRGAIFLDNQLMLAPEPKIYNPLTDKALCFDLMVKHKIDMVYVGNWSAWCAVYDGGQLYNENPQHAICLAIIAKHK